MSYSYLTSNETPAFKFKENTTTAAAVAWTPRASCTVGIAGVYVSTGGDAAAGTFQLRFGNVGGNIIMTGALAASSSVNTTFPIPVTDGVMDHQVFFETSTSASSGGWNCTLTGFDYNPN